MAGLGAGATASAFFPAPDELVTPNPARGVQPLLRILRRYRMTEQVPYGYRQAFS